MINDSNSYSPILAITMGDPAGIGPEIVLKAWSKLHHFARLVCLGDAGILSDHFEKHGIKGKVHCIETIDKSQFLSDALDVLDVWPSTSIKLVPGLAQEMGGNAAFQYIIHAIDLALGHQVDAVVTAPINKEALFAAGHHFDGHTEIFAQRTGAKSVTMMLASGHFRVTHVSTHVSLKEAIDRCKTSRILQVIQLTDQGLQFLGIDDPYIAVAGLNPHSSEGGLFGNEEQEQIQPAIDLAIEEGLKVFPFPVPGDTVFHRMNDNKEFDAVVAQYHDQGHIPSKLVDFYGGVNITLGLPIIRTSVDHGTAFDIVGKGIANETSLINALKIAKQMALAKRITQ